jgi:integrase
MTRRHLTAVGLSRIKPPAVGQVDHFDAGYPGLALRISYGGSRSWVYFYRWQGKQKRLTLGPWPALELAQARDAWRDARKRLASGLEPIVAPPAASTDDFASVAADWLKRDQAENRSHDEVKRILDREVLPEWGPLRISEISRRQVLDLIDAIADRGAVTLARRCHAHLHRLFRWSVGRGTIDASPMVDLPKPGVEVRRKRVLSDEELAHAWRAAQQMGWPMGSAIQLLVLTAARREEIGALEWREIDRARNEIRLEGDRTKNGEAHTIPLSLAAQKLLGDAPRIDGSAFVFSTTGTTPISGWSRAKRRLDQLMLAAAQSVARERSESAEHISLAPWRLHDLRRTIATGMERLGIRLQVVEAMLGHIAGSRAGIVGVYQQHTYAEEKRDAVAKWAEHFLHRLSETAADDEQRL